MSLIQNLAAALLMAAPLAAPMGAQAAPISFFGEDFNNDAFAALHPNADVARDSFFANLGSIGTESFETIRDRAQPPLQLDFGGAGTAVLKGEGLVSASALAITGRQAYRTPTGFTLDFSAPIAAFGFYAIDMGDAGGQLVLGLTNAGGTTRLTVPHQRKDPMGNGAVLYFGFYDRLASYTSISFSTAVSDVFRIDDASVGTPLPAVAVPEPATLALFGAGLLGLGLTRRRRA